MVNISGIGADLSKLFKNKKAVKVAAEEVTAVIEKKVPKAMNGIKSSETVAFGFPKQLDRDSFYKLENDLYKQNNLVNTLKSEGAPETLIKHAQSKSPLKYDPKASLPEKCNTSEFKEFLSGKNKDRQIQKFINNKELKAQEEEKLLKQFEAGHIDFSKTNITNPDEILGLINSGKYPNNERSLLEALSKTGNSTHAEKLLLEVDDLFAKTAENAKNNIFGAGDSLSNRVMTIGLIGNEKQKADLAAKLQRELTITENRDVTKAIFNGIGRIGKSQPKNTEFSEILLNNTFNSNQRLAYKQLANFDNQFHVIAHGMKQNPESKVVLAAAYKSAKTPEQKEILLKEVLANPTLKETAISSTTQFGSKDVCKNYKADILSKIAEKSSFETLPIWAKNHLNDALSRN